MTADLDRLRREADRRSRDFSASVAQARRRVQPRWIAEDLFTAIDPELQLMNRLESAIRRHPAIAVATLFGISWLAAQALTHGQTAGLARTRRPRRLLTFAPQKATGDPSHGHDESEQRDGKVVAHAKEAAGDAAKRSSTQAPQHLDDEAERAG